jgi:hypothetical protein
MKKHRCDECGKQRRGVTVFVEGDTARDLCPACLPPLPRSRLAHRTGLNPEHRDPLYPSNAVRYPDRPDREEHHVGLHD